MVQVQVSISNIVCDEFDQTVFDLAMDSLLPGATFFDATCASRDGGDGVSTTSEVSLARATR